MAGEQHVIPALPGRRSPLAARRVERVKQQDDSPDQQRYIGRATDTAS